MLKAFIVDDEMLARDELAYILCQSKRVEVVGEADCIEDAIVQVRKLAPHVVFLDIQLSEDSGLDLARQLLDFDHRPEIVFATAYDDYALKAFELNAVDYILKPFDENRIRQTVDKMIKLRNITRLERPDKLAITVEDRILLMNVGRILYIGSTEGKTVIVTDEQHYIVSEPLVNLERKLQNTPIVRVHRAFLVNLDGIMEIQPWFNSTYILIMKNGSKVPVSRTYLKDLKQLFGF
ncbi:LytR/AlgR family response regulator transcription factor [Effusibacillus consociatus]|uniref:LytR/AlgR family response regulator transcription factor n=1 Tax=Effusibacillus consociatus TaxID=1117041 RepID=A0ABV9PZ45_9BACL